MVLSEAILGSKWLHGNKAIEMKLKSQSIFKSCATDKLQTIACPDLCYSLMPQAVGMGMAPFQICESRRRVLQGSLSPRTASLGGKSGSPKTILLSMARRLPSHMESESKLSYYRCRLAASGWRIYSKYRVPSSLLQWEFIISSVIFCSVLYNPFKMPGTKSSVLGLSEYVRLPQSIYFIAERNH